MIRRLPLLLLPALVGLCLAFQDPQSSGEGARDEPLFRFGLLSDIQYADKETAGTRDYRGSAAKLRACVADLNRRELAFAVQCGDLIDGRETLEGSREDLETVLAILGKLEAPLHHVLGNHCFEVPRAELMPRLKLESGWYGFRRQGWRFLVLDALDVSTCGWPPGTPRHEEAARWLTEHPRSAEHPSALPYNGAVGEDQLKWLKKELAAAEVADEHVVVFGHLPILAEASTPACLLWNHAKVLAALEACPAVVAFIAGHDHAGGRAVHGGIHHLTMRGMVEQIRDGGDYAVVEVFADRLEVIGVGRMESCTLKREAAQVGRDE